MIANMLSYVLMNKEFEIEFYEDAKGNSQIFNFLESLRLKSSKSKDARIQFRQFSLCMELLKTNGVNLSTDVAHQIDGDIWELIPGKNRVLYFYYKDNKFVLLHQFVKKTNKTPQKEITKAKKERDDYKKRFGGEI